MKKLSRKDYIYIKKYCKGKDELSDLTVAKSLVRLKKYREFEDVSRIEALRKTISFIRTYFGLRKFPPDRKLMLKDYIRLQKLYPEASVQSIAVKMQLKYPQLKISTIRTMIFHYKNYGYFTT